MGLNNLTSIGTSIVKSVGNQLDQYYTALTGTIVPRNINGIIQNSAGSIGTSSYKYSACYVDNLLLNDNTISSTDTNGNINLSPDGNGKINLGKTLNVWNSSSYSNNTVYQANEDLFIFATCGTGSLNEYVLNIFTDNNASPTTMVAHITKSPESSTYLSAWSAVKKGDYFRVYGYVPFSGLTTTVINAIEFTES